MDTLAAMMVTLWVIGLFSSPPIGDFVHLLLLAAVVIFLRHSFGSRREHKQNTNPMISDQDRQ